MGVCAKHSRFYRDQKETECVYCKWEQTIHDRKTIRLVNKTKKKLDKKTGTINKGSVQNEIKNWRNKCNQKFSEIIRLMYDNNGVSKCVISGVPKETFGGLWGIHCGHYFPKGKFWWLAYRYENAGPLSYDENINQRESIPAMRMWLVSVWGEEKINKLELDAAIKPKNNDKSGQLLWYKSEYKRLLSDLNNIKINKR